ncbi:MAG: AraC family transcriptional regulator [Clostridia bacterium]|nr:AraC family transcriptional regulator [Clostridia bacterium]
MFYNNDNFTAHFHPSLEFITVTAGKITVYDNETRLELNKGDCLLILPNRIHSIFCDKETNAEYYVCSFATDYCNSFYNELKNKYPKNIPLRIDEETLSFLLNQFICHDTLSIYRIKAIAYTICSEYYNQVHYSDQPQSGDLDLLHRLIAFIASNYSNDITLKETAQHLGYEVHYLSRCFHKYFNFNFKEYVNQLRISEAKDMLLTTNTPITAIAINCGFSSIRNFNRTFINECGVSPKDFRSSHRKK